MPPFSLDRSTIVIVTRNINPSYYSQLFFVNNKILSEHDFLPESIFTSEFVRIVNQKFNLMITGDQIIMTVNEDTATKVLSEMINATNLEIPYFAMGINFDCNYETEEVHTISKQLFDNGQNAVYNYFGNGNSGYGMYFSIDFEEFRLKMEVRPAKIQKYSVIENKIEEEKSVLNCSFNFHKDLQGKNSSDVISAIEKFGDCKTYITKYIDVLHAKMSEYVL